MARSASSSSRPLALRRGEFLRLMGAGALPVAAGPASAGDAPAPASPWQSAGGDGVLRIGVLTDCQYADVDTGPPIPVRKYRRSPQKLADALAALDAMPDLDLLVHLGDAIDRNEASFRVVMPVFHAARIPVHHVAGNHDYSVSGEWKGKVTQALGMPAPHYVVERGGWRLVFLDGNALSLFAWPEGSPEMAAAQEWKKASGRTLADYNGGLGEPQRAWLDEQCGLARTAGQRVILLCHYPVVADAAHSLWDAPEVEAVVAKNRDVIAAWLNGHNHNGNYTGRHGIHFLNFHGMVDTDENAWARVELHPDRMVVTGTGREPSRNLTFPAADTEGQ